MTTNFDYADEKIHFDKKYDVIVVGSGVAGLYSAINLHENLRVLVISKRNVSLCNSSLAQGGVAAVHLPEDSPDKHYQDTCIAGGNQNDPDALNILVHQGPKEVQRLIELGVDFDRKQNGDVHLTLEGGHSMHRIFHHKDCTGKEIEDKLIYTMRNRKNITVAEHTFVSKIEKAENNFFLRLLTENEQQVTVRCKCCILATGGIGRVYKYTTNSAIATGDGICMAYNLGAAIKNLSYVQFHPTAFSTGERERFLISEAVRGEGAFLLNSEGRRFMTDYDKRGELAPRDVVSQSIVKESIKTGNENFYLDISHKDSAFLKERFPMIYSHLLPEGYDLTKDRIPVFPCQHYLMGGIQTDTNGETTIAGLYAAGECACTGVHGNNRLASNSLLEALVFAKRAADNINRNIYQIPQADISFEFPLIACQTEIPKGIRTKTREVMQKCDFVLPNKENARMCFDEIRKIKEDLETNNFKVDSDYIEAKSLVTVASIILKEVSER